MNQLEDNQPREKEVAPPPTNQVPSTQQVLETMQELVAQNKQILQLMLTAQGGAQPGPLVKRAPPLGCQGTPHMGAPHPGATFGAYLSAPPMGAQHGRAPHEGLPPPPAHASHGGDPPLQEDEGENQSMGQRSHFHDNSRGAPNQWDEKIRELQNQLGDVFNTMKAQGPKTMDYLVRQTDMPFKPNVANYPLPQKFKMPLVETFDGKKDPLDHLETYKTLMQLHNVPDEIICMAFPTTLKGSSRQ